MAKNEKSEELYQHALKQMMHDSLQHHDTVDVIIKVLSRRSDFHSMVFKSLCGHSLFWGLLLVTGLIASSLAVNFPDLAEWVLSFVKH